MGGRDEEAELRQEEDVACGHLHTLLPGQVSQEAPQHWNAGQNPPHTHTPQNTCHVPITLDQEFAKRGDCGGPGGRRVTSGDLSGCSRGTGVHCQHRGRGGQEGPKNLPVTRTPQPSIPQPEIQVQRPSRATHLRPAEEAQPERER